MLDPCPELGLPPDDEGDGDEDDDGDVEGGLGSCGMDDDCVELVDEQPASTSAQAADQITLSMDVPGIPDDSRARGSKFRSAAPAAIMVGSGRRRLVQ